MNACNCKCGVPNRRQRLLGGTELKPYEFPWLAQILLEDSAPIEATLINDRYVITSASSVFGYSPFMMKVMMGIHDNCYADITSNTYSVSNLYIHPEFQYVSHENDIALLRLSSAVSFQKRIAPVCLPQPKMNYEHKVATIASWYEALTSDGYETSTCQPRKIDLPVLRSESCTMNLRDSQGCIGVVGSPSILCKDDSGSGILYGTPAGYYELIGILSDFQSCAASSFHSEPTRSDLNLPVYTKVNNYLEWILYQTKDACYCNKI